MERHLRSGKSGEKQLGVARLPGRLDGHVSVRVHREREAGTRSDPAPDAVPRDVRAVVALVRDQDSRQIALGMADRDRHVPSLDVCARMPAGRSELGRHSRAAATAAADAQHTERRHRHQPRWTSHKTNMPFGDRHYAGRDTTEMSGTFEATTRTPRDRA